MGLRNFVEQLFSEKKHHSKKGGGMCKSVYYKCSTEVSIIALSLLTEKGASQKEKVIEQ